mmetsp:Transcript_18992/g.39014  ORF Transcript_18992/g.39014 Transcript_18992/m.39014 type:complete len:174 (+) Transcript_18992:129-650(+)
MSEMKGSRNGDARVKLNNFCAEMITLPAGVCQGSTDFAEQMDIFMRCQHPLDILGMFNDEEVEGGGGDNIIKTSYSGDANGDAQAHRVSGYHAIPRSCEYCGSPDVNICVNDSKCERPRSFFPRERPPFCPKGGSKLWDKGKNCLGVASNGGDAIICGTDQYRSKKNEAVCLA